MNFRYGSDVWRPRVRHLSCSKISWGNFNSPLVKLTLDTFSETKKNDLDSLVCAITL